MKKSDIEISYHNGTIGDPMVNVKVSAIWNLDKIVAQVAHDESDDGFVSWWADNAENNQSLQDAYFEAACENGWEDAQTAADEIFGPSVKVYGAGRSGGWCVVDGLSDVGGWDAIMVSKWSQFAKWVRTLADDIPYQMVTLAYLNAYQAWLDDTQSRNFAPSNIVEL